MARGPRSNRIVVVGLAGEIDYDDADFEGLDSEIQRMFYGDRAGIDGVDLDSHVLLWLLTSRRELGPRADALVHGTDGAYVSVASVWELTIKAMLGNARLPGDFAERLEPRASFPSTSPSATPARSATSRRSPTPTPSTASSPKHTPTATTS